MKRCIAAIDPGLTGAIAFFFPDAPERVSVFDMPVVGSEVEFASIARLLRQHAPAAAWVEQVGPMPTDGAVQAFKFGGAYQAAKVTVGMCDVPMHLVTPQVWKKALRLSGGKEGKEQARALALRLFPASAEHFARVKDHGRAEAALLARYGAGIPTPPMRRLRDGRPESERASASDLAGRSARSDDPRWSGALRRNRPRSYYLQGVRFLLMGRHWRLDLSQRQACRRSETRMLCEVP